MLCSKVRPTERSLLEPAEDQVSNSSSRWVFHLLSFRLVIHVIAPAVALMTSSSLHTVANISKISSLVFYIVFIFTGRRRLICKTQPSNISQIEFEAFNYLSLAVWQRALSIWRNWTPSLLRQLFTTPSYCTGVPENTTVLSMAYNGEGKHFAVSRRNRFHFIDDGPFFDSLEALIEHYSRHNDGLPCTLRAPVRPGKGGSYPYTWWTLINYSVTTIKPNRSPIAYLYNQGKRYNSDEDKTLLRETLWILTDFTVVGPVVSSSLPGWRTSLHAPLTPTAGASPNEPTRQFENASIIAREKLKLKENIGGGEFGSVYSGQYKSFT